MTDFLPRLTANLQAVENRISAACQRADRPRETVRLVAVTKYAAWEWVTALVGLGVTDLGENRPQQLADRAARLTSPVSWHLIGHLQSNKIKLILPPVRWIHSIDSLKLLQAVDRSATSLPARPQLLLEVNVTGEASKDGFEPDVLRDVWPEILAGDHVDVRGLMTMAPAVDDAEEARPAFRQLAMLRDELQERAAAAGRPLPLSELSMGMTGDFEVAIEEGATFVRIGSALFEGLEPPAGH